MPRKKIGEQSPAKEPRLNLRLTPTVDRRLAQLSAFTGESKTSIGGTAMLMGLRLLENEIMGPTLAAASLENMAAQLQVQFEADAAVFASEAAERKERGKRELRKPEPEPEPEPEAGMGLVRRPRAEDELHAISRLPEPGYLSSSAAAFSDALAGFR